MVGPGSGEPDARSEGKQLVRHAGAEAVESAGVVAFEPEAVFESPEDRLDALTDRRQMRSMAGFGLALGAQDHRAVTLSGQACELRAGIALVADHHLSSRQPNREEPQRHVALLLIG